MIDILLSFGIVRRVVSDHHIWFNSVISNESNISLEVVDINIVELAKSVLKFILLVLEQLQMQSVAYGPWSTSLSKFTSTFIYLWSDD